MVVLPVNEILPVPGVDFVGTIPADSLAFDYSPNRTVPPGIGLLMGLDSGPLVTSIR
jgi:hypothetical protein